MQPTGRLLEAIKIFEGVPPSDLEKLAKGFRWNRYSAGQQIISHLDESTDVFIVIEGTVRVIIYSPDGKEVAFRNIPAGEYFGELAAIDGLPRSATIVAIDESIIASMSAETFWQILRNYPDSATCLVKDLTESIRNLTERVFEFSALAVKNRIHAELLRLVRGRMTGENEAVINPAPTHTEIANRISTRREAVARELTYLARVGLVERRRGALVICDVGRLTRLVQEVVGH